MLRCGFDTASRCHLVKRCATCESEAQQGDLELFPVPHFRRYSSVLTCMLGAFIWHKLQHMSILITCPTGMPSGCLWRFALLYCSKQRFRNVCRSVNLRSTSRHASSRPVRHCLPSSHMSQTVASLALAPTSTPKRLSTTSKATPANPWRCDSCYVLGAGANNATHKNSLFSYTRCLCSSAFGFPTGPAGLVDLNIPTLLLGIHATCSYVNCLDVLRFNQPFDEECTTLHLVQ